MRKLLYEKTKRFTATLKEQCVEAALHEKPIWANQEDIGYGR